MYSQSPKTKELQSFLETNYPELCKAVSESPSALEDLVKLLSKIALDPATFIKISLPPFQLEPTELSRWGFDENLLEIAHRTLSKNQSSDRENILATVGAYSIIQPMTLFEPHHAEAYGVILQLSKFPSMDLRFINDGWWGSLHWSTDDLRDFYISQSEEEFLMLRSRSRESKIWADDPAYLDYPLCRAELERRYLRDYFRDPFITQLEHLRRAFQEELKVLLDKERTSNVVDMSVVFGSQPQSAFD